jgi:hypothetical protein
MVSSGQYDGFGDIGKELKKTAMASAIATLALPISSVATAGIMGYITSRAYSFFGGDMNGYASYSRNMATTAWCIAGGLILLFYLAILTYKLRTYKALKDIGERHGNADISALGKHWLVELIMMVATAPLYAVTGIYFVARNSMPYIIYTSASPALLLVDWFAMVLTGMYTVVDGFKKWAPVGQMLTSYKGRAGMQYLTTSQGVGFAIFIISHYPMAYLLVAIAAVGTCAGGSYNPGCSTFSTMGGLLIPVGIASGILTLIATVNHIKGLFRVGNALIDLEEGRVTASPTSGGYYRPQSAPYSAPSDYSAQSSGGGYQHGTWNAPRYSQSMQPMKPVEPVRPVTPSRPAYRDTSAVEAGWQVGNTAAASAATPGPVRGTGRCRNCQAALPPNEDIQFCPYCGANQ